MFLSKDSKYSCDENKAVFAVVHDQLSNYMRDVGIEAFI